MQNGAVTVRTGKLCLRVSLPWQQDALCGRGAPLRETLLRPDQVVILNECGAGKRMLQPEGSGRV